MSGTNVGQPLSSFVPSNLANEVEQKMYNEWGRQRQSWRQNKLGNCVYIPCSSFIMFWNMRNSQEIIFNLGVDHEIGKNILSCLK